MDSKRYIDWYDKGKSDYNGAKILLDHGADYSLVVFHCQQAIEKMLKGFILKNSNELIDGHSLIYLGKKASLYLSDIREMMKDLAFVNQFYIETRYPADIPLPVSVHDANETITIVSNFMNIIGI